MERNDKRADKEKKASYQKGKTQFVNPYNFVPVRWISTETNDYREGTISGVMHCTLLTRTPLALPDTDAVETDKDKHKTYPFMRDPFGRLMIPGSSLRGAIRSVYETATDSCFVTSVEKQKITKRAGMNEHGSPCLLKKDNNEWKLFKAKRYLILISDNRYQPLDQLTTPFSASKGYVTWSQKDLNGHRYGELLKFDANPEDVYITKKEVKVGVVVKSIGSGSREGYLYKGEVPDRKDNKRQTKKHFESIFEDTGVPVSGISASELEDMTESLLTTLEVYNDPSVNRCLSDSRKNFYKGAEDLIRKAEGSIPVWYNDKTKQLSMASIGRVAFHTSIGDLLQEKKPCTGPKLCKACALFGTAKDEAACASRVRITDAILRDEETDETIIPSVTLKELSGPKISYLPFYMDKKGRNWSYDKESDVVKNTPKGRKYYWHNPDKDAFKGNPSLKNGGRTERNSTMELVSAGQTFRFDIYFDRITRNELQELKWALTLGENKQDSKYCYKIGHGKPIGLGSVKFIIEEVKLRTFFLADGSYKVTDEEEDGKIPEAIEKPDSLSEVKSIKALLRILNFDVNQKNLLISYPFIDDARENDNNTAPHKWFSTAWQPGADPTVKWKDIDQAFSIPFFSYRYVPSEGKGDAGGKKGVKRGGGRKGGY